MTLLEAIDDLNRGNPYQRLLEEGCKGKRRSACGCPLAIYFSKVTGRKIMIDGHRAIGVPGVDYFLPRLLLNFITLFDEGYCPELEL